MKAKPLLTLALVGGLVYVLYAWAWPQLRGPAEQQKDRLPPKLVIEMPNPGE